MSRLARVGAVAGIAIVGLTLSACGNYYYRATVQGFVVDAESDLGINEATVRLYAEEVSDASAEGYVVQTSTVTQGGNAGFYSSTVIWSRFFGGEYGQEGDTTTIWVGVLHPDYGSRVVAAEGILSDEANLIATIRLSQTTFDLPALRGRVVDSNGAGVNGVRVVLDLPALDGDDDREDLVTQSATIDGVPGTYDFAPVEWSDQNTADADGELTAIVRVDDPEWGDPGNPGSGPDDAFTIEQSVAIVPADQTRSVPNDFTVFRLPRTEFSATVTGRLFERIEDAGNNFVENRPVQGVRVELSFDRQTDGGLESPFRTLVDTTDSDGVYLFTVTWTDEAPGDYDDADVRASATVGGSTIGIVAGEDGLEVDIAYADTAVGGGTLTFSANSVTNQSIYSNPRGGTNRLPDVIRTVQ